MNNKIEHNRLKANSFGWGGQFFQSIAGMAPAIGVVLNAQLMASRAGSAFPLASVFAMILAVMLAYCLGLLTRKYYGASGYFQIHSRALGSKVGFITSWLFFIYAPFNVFLNAFGVGAIIIEPFSEALGFKIPWWVTVVVVNILITIFSLTNAKKTMRITSFLSIIEFIIFLALGVMLLVKSDHPVEVHYFLPSYSADGIGGLLFAFVFGFLAFVGYESGLPLTEETKSTTTSTFKGLLRSVLLAGIFYVFVNYATVVGFGGGENSAQFAKNFNAAINPYGSILAIRAFGAIGIWVILIACINSMLGCSLSGQNAFARVIFALGRANILPKWLGRSSSRDHIPVNAALFCTTFTFLVAIAFSFLVQKGKELDWYGLLGIIMVLAILIIHLMTCVAVARTYRKDSQEFNFFRHRFIPTITGLLVLLPIGGSVYYNLTPPMCYAPWIVLSWFVIGLLTYWRLKKKKPQSLSALESEMDML